jgi:tetratricopeptide (TPR) repeat protein
MEWRLWGTNATGYHVANVLLHVVNAILVWLILRRLKVPGAWLAGLVFAIHPVNTATVAWISEQKNTLSMLFCAVTVLLYLRFEEEGRWRWYGFSLAAFLLALLSKTAVVMLPFVLLGCVWWMRGRIARKDFLCSVPFFAISMVLGMVTIWFQYNRAMGGQPVRTADFLSRLAGAGWVPWFYLYKALLPFNLSMIYPQWNVDGSRGISFLPGIILVACLLLFWWKRKGWGRPLFFGLGYFVVVLFPVLGFFDQGFYQYSLVADHWQYVAIVGPIALVASAVAVLCLRMSEWNWYVCPVAVAAVLLVLGISTWRRGSIYQDSQTLWQDTVAKNPDAWVAHNNLGLAMANRGKLPESIEQYKQALRIKPDFATAHNNLGTALASQGKVSEAIAEFAAALRTERDYAEAHNNLGNALFLLDNVPEAIAEYAAALRIKPDNVGAHYNLGVGLAGQGRVPEAMAQYREALRLKPDFPPALRKLAWILATDGNANLRNAGEAVQLAERLCAITGSQQTKDLDVLAAAYAEAGRFSDAIRIAQKAVELAGAAGQQELARQVQERLKLYQAGWPFHEGSASIAPAE